MINHPKKSLSILAPLLLLSLQSCGVMAKDYSAAEIYTNDSWAYGKYVFRMRAAQASGVLSNFFLWKPDSELASVNWEEVDIEVFGKNGANSWQSNLITTENGWATSEQVHQHDDSFADDYHTFTLEWTEDYIAWYVDGVEQRRSEGGQTDLITNPANLRFNFWASESVAWVGAFDDSVLPLNMFVNWVEYYSWDGENFALDWRDDFDNFDSNRWSKASWTFDANYVDFVPENASVQDGYLVLTMTNSGEEGFAGTVPIDTEEDTISDPDTPVIDPIPGDDDEDPVTEPASQCRYTITSEWATGYVAEIAISNTGDTTMDGWSVDWEYSDGSVISNLWNADLSGSNPYHAQNIAWNGSIAVNDSVSFGFTVNKGATEAEIPTLSGTSCQ